MGVFLEGGEAVVAGEADEISGVVADDEAMTLTVTLAAPYANFPALAGFQTFMPTPEAAVEAGEDWENELMVGNGPYAMESARNDQEIVLVRNDNWLGDAAVRPGPSAPSGSSSRSTPTPTRRTTPSKPARPTSPASREPGPRRRARIGAPRST